MHDAVSHDATHHDARRAHEHDKNALAHHLDDGRHVHLDQHEYDENGQGILAEARINDRRTGDNRLSADLQVTQENRCRVDEQQRWQVMKKLRLGNLGEEKEERGDEAQHGEHAYR